MSDSVGRLKAQRRGTEKRLSEAEMAAEFHRASYQFSASHSMGEVFTDESWKKVIETDRERMYTMERIGRAPHADENGYL